MAWTTFALLGNHHHQAPPGNLLLTNSVTCTCHPTLHLSHPRRKDTSPPSFLPLSPLVWAGDTRAARRKKKAAMSHNNSQMWKSATGKKSNLIWQQKQRKNVKNFTLQRRSNDSTKIMHLNPKQHKMEKKKKRNFPKSLVPQRHKCTSVWHLHRTQENITTSFYPESLL